MRQPSGLQFAISGMLTLAVAIGIGRFAFTPILPIMQKDPGLSLAATALLTAGMGVTDHPLVWLTLRALAGIASAWALGGTFMVATMAGMQEARRVAPGNASSLMAAMTAAFGIGQILGPVLVSIVAGDPRGMDLTLIAASVVRILGALVLLPTKFMALNL